MDETVKVKAKDLYDSINRYYSILIDSITLEDYNSIKDILNYTDEYEEHINNIKSFIKAEETTINEIENFIAAYPEFQRKHYVKTINLICNEIERNPNKFKHEAYKGILKFVNELNNYEDEEIYDIDSDEIDGEEINDIDSDEIDDENVENTDNEDYSDNDEMIYTIGNNEIIMKTHGDPLLKNLYNVLFMIFETENGF
jgi:hypothetical protein